MRLPDPAVWHEVAVQPAIGIALTVTAYLIAQRLSRFGGGHPLLNPTLIAIVIVASMLKLTGLSYADYAQSAAVVSFLLSPAVVLLAVPLFRQRSVIKTSGRVVAGALAVGLPTGVLSAMALAWLFGADERVILSLAPKSATAGIAIGVAQKIGGLPALTAVLVIMTGITGAITGPLLMRLLRVRDERAIGLAMGITSHGIGTARALQIGETAGAFSGLGMGLNGVLIAVLLPLAFTLF